MTQFVQDLAWSVRLARRRPLFTLTVAATLAVSIAAAATTYGLATAVLWRPLPFPDEDRLVFVWETQEVDGQRRPARVTSGRAVEWRTGTRALSSMAVFAAAGLTAEDPGGAAAPLHGVRVSADYFDVLALRPTLGRGFLPEDEKPGAPPVIVLSHALWQERFGGDPRAVGSRVRLSGAAYTIVGVMPPVVTPGWPANPAIVTIDARSREFWIPIARTPQFDQQMGAHVYGVVARLARGVTREQAAAELTGLVSIDAADRHGAQVTPLRDQFVRDARLPLLAMVGAALAVLLIACANLAALQATAIEARRSELAVRAAIGAGRSRLVQQLGVESLMMAAAGGLGGVALTRLALNEIPSRLPPSVPLLTLPALDWRVAVFALAITVLAGVGLAAWPVVRLARAPASRGVAAGGRRFIFRGLVVAQVAVTAALAVAAALLTQSLGTVRGGDPGFVIDNVLVTTVGLPATVARDPATIAGIEARMLQAIGARPGVIGAALAYDHPLQANWIDAITLIGEAAAGTSDARTQVELRIVSPGYFNALGVEVLDGRAFGPRDDLSAPGAVMVNDAFARTLQPGLVLGRTLRSSAASFTWGDRAPRVYTIVGIVENERFRGLEQPVQPAVYVSTQQFPQQGTALLVRTAGDPLAIAADVRGIVRAIEPGVTMAAPQSLSGILRDQLVTRRATTDVFGGFAAAALVLAALGLYGLTAGVVSNRTREIGVRLALGASPGAVARHVVDDSLITAGTGVAAGLVLALGAGRLIESLLVGVGARDPVTLAIVAATLLIVATLAALLPARRAASIDPAVVLRGE